MTTLNYVVAIFVAIFVLFGSVVPASAQWERVRAVMVDSVETIDGATYVVDTAGKTYRFDTADASVNTIDTAVEAGSFIDPSGCRSASDSDYTFGCFVLDAWTGVEWTTVYVHYGRYAVRFGVR